MLGTPNERRRQQAATVRPVMIRNPGATTTGTGGPRARPTTASEWAGRNLAFGNTPSPSTSQNPLQEPSAQTPIADHLLEQTKLEEGARKELEDELLKGIKDDLRRLSNDLDADNWMYSAPFVPLRM